MKFIKTYLSSCVSFLSLFLIPVLALSEPMFAVTTTNQLVRFDSDTPEAIISTRTISGLQPGENVLAADFRPANALLYALGSTSRLYTVNLNTGVASLVGSGPFTPLLSGTVAAFDFNPVVDALRIVTDSDQNLRLNPTTGVIINTDTPVEYAAGDTNFGVNPFVSCAAYTNNFVGATSTTLFVVDPGTASLVLQGGAGGTPSPNTGTLFTQNPLGIASSTICGLDISSLSGMLYGSFTALDNLSSSLVRINYGTGFPLTFLGRVGGGVIVRDISGPIQETVAPVVTLISPNRSRVTTNRTSLTFRGTVTDNTLVETVQFRIIKGRRASRFRNVAINSAGEFRFTARLELGTSKVEIRAIDLWGNVSATTSVRVTRNNSR